MSEPTASSQGAVCTSSASADPGCPRTPTRPWRSGAEVRGWDLRETIFTKTLGAIDVDYGDEPRPPEGWEVVVSTAHAARIEGTPRAAFLAELVAAQPSIVVAGAHGKTTTAGMIAFALREAGA